MTMAFVFSKLYQLLLPPTFTLLLLLCSGCGGSSGTATVDEPMKKAPEILQQPSNVSADLGDNIEFVVAASGTGTLHYQWQRDSVDIPGATLSKYSLTYTQAGDAKSKWSVVISNANGSIRSNEVRVRPKGIALLAGSIGGIGSTDGVGLDARFGELGGIAVDRSGNIFVSDYSNHVIRKISPSGHVSTLAGLAGHAGFENGIGRSARFFYPKGIAVDLLENVYVFDRSCTIRKINSTGLVTNFAGKLGLCKSSDGKTGDAQFLWPIDLQSDAYGNLYVMEFGPSQAPEWGDLRKITLTGEVSTVLKSDPSPLYSERRLYRPRSFTVTPNGSIYVSSVSTIRRVDQNGIVHAFVGGEEGYRDETGKLAQFSGPVGLAASASGDMFVADTYNNVIRKVDATGIVTTLAGQQNRLEVIDGVGKNAGFSAPKHLARDTVGNLYVTDYSSVRKIDTADEVTTIAGSVQIKRSTDGIGSAASFAEPSGIALDHAGNTYVFDGKTQSLRKITNNAMVSTVARNLAIKLDGRPKYIATDSVGNIYIPGHCAVIKVSPTGEQSVLRDATGLIHQLCDIEGIAIDANNNIYLSRASDHFIQKITPTGVISNVAGSSGNAGATDGTGSAARFNEPIGLALDGKGNIYVADKQNSSIRKISVDGMVSTLFGGHNAAISIGTPSAITADQAGNVYVAFGETPINPWEIPPAPTNQHCIVRISNSGVVTTIVGKPGVMGISLGKMPGGLISPLGLAINSDDVLFVTAGSAVLRIQL